MLKDNPALGQPSSIPLPTQPPKTPPERPPERPPEKPLVVLTRKPIPKTHTRPPHHGQDQDLNTAPQPPSRWRRLRQIIGQHIVLPLTICAALFLWAFGLNLADQWGIPVGQYLTYLIVSSQVLGGIAILLVIGCVLYMLWTVITVTSEITNYHALRLYTNHIEYERFPDECIRLSVTDIVKVVYFCDWADFPDPLLGPYLTTDFSLVHQPPGQNIDAIDTPDEGATRQHLTAWLDDRLPGFDKFALRDIPQHPWARERYVGRWVLWSQNGQQPSH